MYEPKHESQYKVGDWVEFIDVGGRTSQGKYESIGYNAIIVLDITCNMRCVVPTTKIIRKLKPSEIVVRIGCLSGTIAKSSDPNHFLMIHSRPITDCNYSIIRFSAIDTPIREIVESLLKAQKEEECQAK